MTWAPRRSLRGPARTHPGQRRTVAFGLPTERPVTVSSRRCAPRDAGPVLRSDRVALLVRGRHGRGLDADDVERSTAAQLLGYLLDLRLRADPAI